MEIALISDEIFSNHIADVVLKGEASQDNVTVDGKAFDFAVMRNTIVYADYKLLLAEYKETWVRAREFTRNELPDTIAGLWEQIMEYANAQHPEQISDNISKK